jgi:hypothetical protein
MTTPTLYSDVAGNPFIAKGEPQGVIAQKFTLTLPATTAADTVCGVIRFQKGFTLTGLAFTATDMDAEDDLLLDVGFVYDSADFTDNEDAILDGSTVAQAGGSYVWPVAAGLLIGESFTAEGDGYLSFTVKANTVETAGTITGIATFTYNV